MKTNRTFWIILVSAIALVAVVVLNMILYL